MNFPTNNILIIAEKPSLALAIAKELPSKYQDKGSYIDCGNFRVSKLAGHVLSLYEPDEYNNRYKKWNLGDLPIVPSEFKLKPSATKEKTVDSVKEQLKWCDEVWNAGDPDREGQLLVDELLEYLEYKGKVNRLLVSDTSPKGVQQSLNKIIDNSKFFNLYQAAKCRSHTDWLLGINMSRLTTLLAKQKNYQGVISVGRVQTAILALIVRRYNTIKNFKPIPYYDLEVRIKDFVFHLENKMLESNNFLDESYRIIEKTYAEELLKKLLDKTVTINKETEEVEKNQPYCYSLSTLQKESAEQLGFKASETLEIAQSLYEKYKIITYPRSDCKYLPEEQYNERESIVKQIFNHFSDLESHRGDIDFNIKSISWNTKKVTAHFAIIPNSNDTVDFYQLGKKEKQLYKLISIRYLQQFLPKQKYINAKIILDVEKYKFKTTVKNVINEGWNILTSSSSESKANKLDVEIFKNGDTFDLSVENLKIVNKETKPPLLFTESTLLTAINNAKRYLKDKDRKLENFTLGTPATQSSMLDKLIDRKFIEFQKKNYVPTTTGIELISVLPDSLTYPDLTVLWEERFSEIESGDLDREEFEKRVVVMIEKLTEKFKKEGIKITSNVVKVSCPVCKKGFMRIFDGIDKNKKKYVRFSCQNEECKASLFNSCFGKKLSSEYVQILLDDLNLGTNKGSNKLLKFKSKNGKEYKAGLKLKIEQDKLKYELVFENQYKTKNK